MQITRNSRKINLSATGKTVGLSEECDKLKTEQPRLANSGATTLLFIDEIHRFNKSQQDTLLPDVENGIVRLIGATTHNPFFFVNSPLVSRSQIF